MPPQFFRRPPRLDRLFDTIAPFYFITFNTHQRAQILSNTEVHDAFRDFCERAHSEFNVAVGRYVLMPDHVHLFVHLPREIRLERWVQSLRSNLGKRLVVLGTSQPHWQEGFFDHVMRSGESYAAKWEYVRENPVRAGLCKEADRWPFQGEIVRIVF